MHKKSQAAMEFLMTYGWAILVVLVAIGALAYFGVLSPCSQLLILAVDSPVIFAASTKGILRSSLVFFSLSAIFSRVSCILIVPILTRGLHGFSLLFITN